MRRTWRIISGGLMVLSLVLCLAMLAEWVRSYWTADFVEWSGWRIEPHAIAVKHADTREDDGFLRSQRGYLTLWRRKQHIDLPPPTAEALVRENPRKGPSWSTLPARVGGILFSSSDAPESFLERAGFYYRVRAGRSASNQYYDAAAPFWAVATPLAIPGVLWLMRWRIRRRRKQLGMNLCANCGYDLRATPDRCPECGLKPEK